MKLVFFHRNHKAGYSINKVTQTIIRDISNKEEYELPNLGPSPIALMKNLWFVYKHRRKDAINHVTGDAQYAILALFGCKSVLTCHDTVSLDYRRLSFFKRLFFEWFWYRLPLRFATKVVAISEETKRCLKRYTNRDDIVVIHNAIDPLFMMCPPKKNSIPVILLIGTGDNKNLIRTFEALEGFKCHVVIIGVLSQEQRECLKNNNISYEYKSGLTDEQIVEEYAKCDVVSFISLFEGFGMIVVEANKVGRPVICSDISVLREIGGDAALFVNPEDVNDMRSGFEKMFNDMNLRKSLVEKGFANVERFAPSLIKKQWLRLYDGLS